MYLMDTDVLSALRRRERDPRVVQWLARQRTGDIYLSVVTVGEIERGMRREQRHNPPFARDLAAWLEQVLTLYEARILPVDLPVAKRWGRLSADLGHQNADLLIAATALERGLIVVTRNVRHFEPTGVPVLNPFENSQS